MTSDCFTTFMAVSLVEQMLRFCILSGRTLGRIPAWKRCLQVFHMPGLCQPPTIVFVYLGFLRKYKGEQPYLCCGFYML